MLLLAKVMNFVSGLIILVTGVYVDVRFEQILAGPMRVAVGVLALGYFLVQLYRLIREEDKTVSIPAATAAREEFNA